MADEKSITEMVEERRQEACPCGKGLDHTVGEHLAINMRRDARLLNMLEPHLGCVLCRKPGDTRTGKCQGCGI